MLEEDDRPRGTARLLTPPPLDRLGFADLEAYITELRGEITRAEAEIARKQAVAQAAQGFFRTPPT